MDSTSLQADGVTDRPNYRLTTLYSLKLSPGKIAQLDPRIEEETHIAGHLRFGRLAVHYRTAGEQFPKVLFSGDIATPSEGPRNAGSLQIERSRLWLFRVPHGCLVLGMTLDFGGSLAESVPLLEDAYYGEITMGSDSLLDVLRRSTGSRLAPLLETARIGGHGHQLLFVPDSCQDLVQNSGMNNREVNHDLVRRLIYRYDVPYRPDSGLVVFPPEANRRMRALAACGPYFSVLASQQDYVENCALVTAVQLVGAADLLAATRAEAFETLSALRSLQNTVDETSQIERPFRTKAAASTRSCNGSAAPSQPSRHL